MSSKKVYICGKVTSRSPEERRKAFIEAEKDIGLIGYLPVNPVKICASLSEGDFTHEEYMKICLAALSFCDYIYQIDEDISEGMRQELEFWGNRPTIYGIDFKKEIIDDDIYLRTEHIEKNSYSVTTHTRHQVIRW